MIGCVCVCACVDVCVGVDVCICEGVCLRVNQGNNHIEEEPKLNYSLLFLTTYDLLYHLKLVEKEIPSDWVCVCVCVQVCVFES